MGYAERFWLPSSAKSRNIDLYRLRDEQAIGDNDHRRRPEVEPLHRALGLQNADPEPLGRFLRRRRDVLPSPTCWRIRARQQRGDRVPCREPLEHVGAEGRGRGDRDLAQLTVRRGLAEAEASRARCAGTPRRCGRG